MPVMGPPSLGFAETDALIVGPHCLLSYNGIVFNDLRSGEGYRVEDFVGFDDADLKISDEDNTQEDGSTPGPGFYGTRTMTMTGFIEAGDYPRLLVMQRDLQDALLDLVERPLVISTLEGVFTQPEVQIYCRKADKALLSKKIEQNWLTGGIRSPFTVAFKATDPVYRSTALYDANIVPTVISLRGRGYPRGYPLGYTQLMDSSGNPASGANSATVVNAGNWYALPRLRFNGFMDGIVLRDETNGHQVRLKYAVQDGDWIEIDVATGEIVDALSNNKADYFDTGSDWMRFVGTRDNPDGENLITLAVSDFGENASVGLWWQDSYMGG